MINTRFNKHIMLYTTERHPNFYRQNIKVN